MLVLADVSQCSAVRAYISDSASRRLRYRASDKVYSRLPLALDYGLYQVQLPAQAGCELVLDYDIPASVCWPLSAAVITAAGAMS